MLFNSVEYVVLLGATVFLYWLLPWTRARQVIVFVASLYFYMSWSVPFGLMLLIVMAVNWGLGWLVQVRPGKTWLVVACVLNLGMLAYFKYMNFFLDNLYRLANAGGGHVQPFFLDIVLPLGISFYVFELISYHVDVHKGVYQHERSPLAFSIFVLFFPHLIAGPICRAAQFIPQLHVKQRFNAGQFYNGLYMFMAGLALKSGLADGIAPYVNVIFKDPATYSGFDNLMATVGFGAQIFCDFWGYSLMALGAALLFGYVLPYNFDQPYASLSIRDFWRRWHITLSNWLRDYLYIGAFGGSKVDRQWKVQRNLMLTMLLGGLWHGASWNFVIWGGIHGFALAVNRWYDHADLPAIVRKTVSSVPVAWSLTMLVVFVAWIFFRADTLNAAVVMVAHIFGWYGNWASTRLAPLFFELMLIFPIACWFLHRTTYKFDIAAQPIMKAAVAFMLVAMFATIYYVDGNDFIYFQF